MFRRTTPTPATANDVSELLRRPDKPLPYRFWLRWLDVIGGRRDGRRGLAGTLEHGYQLTPDQTTWLRHNTHRHTERVHSETVRHDALALALHQEADALPGKIKDAKKTLRDARAALAALPQAPPQPGQRRATETHTPAAVVTDRRTREHHATVLAPAQAKVTAAEQALTVLRARRREIRATLTALEAVHTQRTGRLAEYHARRAHAYERAYLRRIAGTPHDTTT